MTLVLGENLQSNSFAAIKKTKKQIHYSLLGSSDYQLSYNEKKINLFRGLKVYFLVYISYILIISFLYYLHNSITKQLKYNNKLENIALTYLPTIFVHRNTKYGLLPHLVDNPISWLLSFKFIIIVTGFFLYLSETFYLTLSRHINDNSSLFSFVRIVRGRLRLSYFYGKVKICHSFTTLSAFRRPMPI